MKHERGFQIRSTALWQNVSKKHLPDLPGSLGEAYKIYKGNKNHQTWGDCGHLMSFFGDLSPWLRWGKRPSTGGEICHSQRSAPHCRGGTGRSSRSLGMAELCWNHVWPRTIKDTMGVSRGTSRRRRKRRKRRKQVQEERKCKKKNNFNNTSKQTNTPTKHSKTRIYKGEICILYTHMGFFDATPPACTQACLTDGHCSSCTFKTSSISCGEANLMRARPQDGNAW